MAGTPSPPPPSCCCWPGPIRVVKQYERSVLFRLGRLHSVGEASDIMMGHPLALRLRNLQSLVEIGVDQNSTVVFPAPLVSTIGELGSFLGRMAGVSIGAHWSALFGLVVLACLHREGRVVGVGTAADLRRTIELRSVTAGARFGRRVGVADAPRGPGRPSCGRWEPDSGTSGPEGAATARHSVAGRHSHRVCEDIMMENKHWSVTVTIDEHDGHTRALARLRTRDTDRMTGVGLARLNPADHDVPEVGDELAVARALADLSDRLMSAAAADIGDSAVSRVR